MPHWFKAACAALLAALAPACDIVNLPQIQPGITTATEVRQRMGEPGEQYDNGDGSVTWEYSRQPAGVQCYMITIGADQRVSAFEQVLTEANYARAREGMTRDQIRRLYGRPARIQQFDNLREEVWEWRIEGTPPLDETYFNVHFDQASGLVKKALQRIERRG